MPQPSTLAPLTKNTQVISRGLQYRGKLVAMPSTSRILQGNDLWGSAEKKGLAIEFPAMPDSIELSRASEYTVATSPFTPDGLHQYMGTRPMEMPISFKLHAFDANYCQQGALTLLQIAARLHAFVLPITTERVAALATTRTVTKGNKTDDETERTAQTGELAWKAYGINSNSAANIYPPVTCWLHLIWADEGMPGISCVGYVKDVRVILHGPYLKGPGGSFNLPSAGDFSFTFVHRPGHNNSFGSDSTNTHAQVGAQVNAYATDVRDSFYNTRNLVYVANYKGLDDGVPESPQAQAAIQAEPPGVVNASLARQGLPASGVPQPFVGGFLGDTPPLSLPPARIAPPGRP
jgi:hypothetical protein